MSSILTNTGAMVALQTMRGINRSMETTQSQISTGLRIGSAKDNAATWAISRVMESDVSGFRSIKESLALGNSTVNVARNAAETTTRLLTEIKEKIVLAQEENVDRGKIQDDIVQLRNQIATVVSSAQFNGLNLVDNFRTESVLSSLNRAPDGVTPSRISVPAQDLTMRSQVFGTAAARTGQATVTAPGALAAASDSVAGADITIAGTATAGSTATMTFAVAGRNVQVSVLVNTGDTAAVVAERLTQAIGQNEELSRLGVRATQDAADVQIRLTGEARATGASITGSGALGGITVPAGPTAIAASFATATVGNGTVQDGDSFRITYGGQNFDFVANDRSTRADVLAGLAKAINDSNAFFARVSSNGQAIEITSTGTAAVAAGAGAENSGGTSGGGLRDLATLDVADFSRLTGGATGLVAFNDLTAAEQRAVIRDSLERSLGQIESMIQTSIAAASAFGQVQKRIEIQQDFVSGVMDSLRTGIGALVDADMEEASARLQALQVQQQLAIQSLSIANQQPQNILALFR